MIFENRYMITKERYMEWIKHPIKKSMKYVMKIIWSILFVFILCLTVFQFVVGSADAYILYFSCLLLLFCAYRVFFRTTIIANKQFKETAHIQGAEEWERVTSFSDEILVADGCSTTHFDYSIITELVDYKGYLALGIGEGLNKSYLRLAKEGFGQSSDSEFVEFIKREHPNIVVRRI